MSLYYFLFGKKRYEDKNGFESFMFGAGMWVFMPIAIIGISIYARARIKKGYATGRRFRDEFAILFIDNMCWFKKEWFFLSEEEVKKKKLKKIIKKNKKENKRYKDLDKL